VNDNPSPEDQLAQLAQRLENLERLVQSQIQRVFSLEQRLGKSASHNDMPSVLTSEDPQPKKTENEPTVPVKQRFEENSFRSQLRPQAKTLRRESLEEVIGGSWLNKIGIIAIILGMAYFLKYAIDNEWLGEAGRVMLGVVTGLALLFAGEGLHRKQYRSYGLSLAAGGIAILYFSIFAAFNLYSLIPQLPALFLMVLITISAVLTALRHDARVIAWIGILGGFLTPVMLGTGRDNQVGLFIYIALLDLGVLALAYFKHWRILNLLAFVLTQLTFLAWSVNFYAESKLWRTEFFLTLFFFLFAVVSFLYNIVHQKAARFSDLALVFLNGVVYFLSTYALLEPSYFDYLGLCAILMALIHLGLGAVAHQRSPQDKLLFLVFLAMALTFVTLAIPIQLKQNWITVGWAVEAVVLTWIGFHLSESKIRLAAFWVGTPVAIRLLFYDSIWTASARFDGDFTFLINARAFSFAVGIFAMFAMAYLHTRYRERLTDRETARITGLVVAANFLLVFFLTTEIGNYFGLQHDRAGNYEQRREINNQKQLSISACWAVYSIILVILGVVKKYQPIRVLAIVLFGATIFKVFLLDLSNLERIYRISSFIGLGVILLAVSFIYQKYRNQINHFVLK
jgi:uncharacterized membrane protein